MLLSCPLELRHHTPTLGASCSTLKAAAPYSYPRRCSTPEAAAPYSYPLE